MSIPKKLFQRLRHYAQWRCQEPVVVIESDDWGLHRTACAQILKTFGKPGTWADEQSENINDLSRLYQILEKYRDSFGRPACFTANFIVANPDFAAISRGQFITYAEVPINHDDALREKWLQGKDEQVFFPQYHGRSHFWPQAWLDDLQSQEPTAFGLFELHIPGGMALLEGQGWRYHSEYYCWSAREERSPENLEIWLKGGMKLFQDTFGYRSLSTIAPHYVFTPKTLQGWQSVGIKFIQGAGYRIIQERDKGTSQVISHALGELSDEGLTLLTRTLKFEPRSSRLAQGIEPIIQRAKDLIGNHVPVVVDTHRINYTGAYRDYALLQLDLLLSVLQSYHVRFLTTIELGEAIANRGVYHDLWTGELRKLTPLDSAIRRSLRKCLGRYNSYVVRKFMRRD